MFDCQNVRKVVLTFQNQLGGFTTITKYYDGATGNELTARQISKCRTIPSIDVVCATVC